MKLYIIAGEASGDLHAADLLKALKERIPVLNTRAWGGDLLKAEGAEIVKHYRDLAFMGFTEVLMNLRTILKNIGFCKKDIIQFRPDAIILVDYPGFNLRIAEFAKKSGIPVYYYISPQVWAWKESRVKKIREVVDKLFVILPFEKEFYKKFNYDVEYVGHPLPDVLNRKRIHFPDRNTFLTNTSLPEKPIIALLPGSRKQEISSMLPIMLSVQLDFPEYQFVVAAAPSLADSFYNEVTGEVKIPVIKGLTYELLIHSHAALVTSGTATLETALLNIPQIVCYKGGTISYLIARALIKIKFISLVNLIMDKEVVKELIQNDLTTQHLKDELSKIVYGSKREQILNDYASLQNKLKTGGAAKNTADLICKDLLQKGIL